MQVDIVAGNNIVYTEPSNIGPSRRWLCFLGYRTRRVLRSAARTGEINVSLLFVVEGESLISPIRR